MITCVLTSVQQEGVNMSIKSGRVQLFKAVCEPHIHSCFSACATGVHKSYATASWETWFWGSKNGQKKTWFTWVNFTHSTCSDHRRQSGRICQKLVGRGFRAGTVDEWTLSGWKDDSGVPRDPG